MEIARVGTFTLGWGESLVWDEQRRRLLLRRLRRPDVALARRCGRRAAHAPAAVDAGRDRADRRTACSSARCTTGCTSSIPIAARAAARRYPDAIGGRCNDACADLDGNLITGKLNMGPEEGSAWWYSASTGGALDDDISNTNGPAVGVLDGVMTLIIGDTSADYFSYPYDPHRHGRPAVDVRRHERARRPSRRLHARRRRRAVVRLVGGSQLARFTTGGFDRTVALPVTNPTDVTFGGPGPRPAVRREHRGRCRDTGRPGRRAARHRRARCARTGRASLHLASVSEHERDVNDGARRLWAVSEPCTR